MDPIKLILLILTTLAIIAACDFTGDTLTSNTTVNTVVGTGSTATTTATRTATPFGTVTPMATFTPTPISEERIIPTPAPRIF